MTPPRVYTALFPFCGLGAGARGFLDATVTLFGRESRFRSLGGIDIEPESCRDFEYLTGSPALCADVSKLTAAELRAFAGDAAPDVVFMSPPCKGASGLLSGEKAKSPKYEALNRLALDWTERMLEAWGAEPPRLVLLENVPGITTRAPHTLREVKRLLRAAGYVFHAGTHDCGEVGGLAQHRRRFLLVARHQKRVPTLLYQPAPKRVRGCGEVLGALPMPGDPAAGPLHKLPRISWLNWVRLALIPAGGDWRDIPAAVSLPTGDRRGRHENKYRVGAWDEPAGTVIGATRPGSGAPNVADPRLEGFGNVLRVVPWDGAAGTVTAAGSPSNGTTCVADPRVPDGRYPMNWQVRTWGEPSACVTGATDIQAGAQSVADPRVHCASHPHTYGVLPWNGPAHTVTGKACVGSGPFSVADPRLNCAPRAGAYGIVPWGAPSGTITGSLQVDNGPAAVADPRIPADWTDPPADPPPVILALDGTWHRPLTTLELAALQGIPTVVNGAPLELAGRSVAGWRERIGNAVPVGTAAAIARQMLATLAGADAERFVLSGEGSVWVDRRLDA